MIDKKLEFQIGTSHFTNGTRKTLIYVYMDGDTKVMMHFNELECDEIVNLLTNRNEEFIQEARKLLIEKHYPTPSVIPISLGKGVFTGADAVVCDITIPRTGEFILKLSKHGIEVMHITDKDNGTTLIQGNVVPNKGRQDEWDQFRDHCHKNQTLIKTKCDI